MMRFIIYRLLGSFLMLMILLLICLWMIRLIPGSYEDLLELDEYNLRYESNLQIEKKPLFYFSVFPVASTIPKNQTIWPEFTWNGLQNEFHQNMVSYFSLQFGKSISDGVSVKDKFLKALPWSLMIQVPAILIILICSVFFAIRSIQYPDSKILKSIDTILIWIHSLPGFWIATLLLLLFANPVVFAWLPSGMQAVSSSNPFILWFTSPQYLILPLISLALRT
jgi:ABC-type dipeptide/oligopeptide/nickel transport system permease component